MIIEQTVSSQLLADFVFVLTNKFLTFTVVNIHINIFAKCHGKGKSPSLMNHFRVI